MKKNHMEAVSIDLLDELLLESEQVVSAPAPAPKPQKKERFASRKGKKKGLIARSIVKCRVPKL